MHLPRRSIPQISGLIAFEATARHLSFSRAAEELSLSQGAVTKRVRKLENQLNVVLMSRGGHQAQLTRFGRIFLPQVQSILAQIDRTTRDLLAEASQHRTVTVKGRCGANPGLASSGAGRVSAALPRSRDQPSNRRDRNPIAGRSGHPYPRSPARDRAYRRNAAVSQLLGCGGQQAGRRRAFG